MKLSDKSGSGLTIIAFAALVGFAILTNAQAPTPAPPKYQPTEIQLLKLQVKQKDARLAQVQAAQAQAQFQAAMADLMKEAESIKVENKWPAEVIFNADNVSYQEPVKQPTPEVKK